MNFRRLAFPVLLFASLLAAQSTPKVVGGPFVITTAPRSATVVWVVQTSEVTVHSPSGADRVSPVLHAEKTTLTSLPPNSKIEYSVSGETLKGSFKTPPAANSADPYRFVVYGDTRTRHDVHRKVIAELVKNGIPDFVVHTGDQVEDGYDARLWPIFFDAEKDLLRQTVFFPSLGNHERNSSYYFELLQQPKPYYSFDWGNAHFTVMNTDKGNMAPSPAERDALWNEEVRWLEQDLKDHQTATWRFIVGHHPPMSAVSRRQTANEHMTALMPLFEKYKVQALFFGHDHTYQHYLKDNIHYFVSGGGGAPLYDVDKPPPGITVKVASIENWINFEVNGKTMHFRATAIDGSVLDEGDIKQ